MTKFDPAPLIADGGCVRRYRVNQAIFSQGDPADTVFYLEQGSVKLSLRSPRGKEAVIAILTGGEFFGEGCLAEQRTRPFNAIAIAPSSVVSLNKPVMQQILRDEPEFAALFIHRLLSGNIRVEEDVIDQLFNSCEKRLARMLLLMAHFGKDGHPEPVIATIDPEKLAEMTGTTRSRVRYFMNKFRKLGFIEDDDGLRVHTALLNVLLRD